MPLDEIRFLTRKNLDREQLLQKTYFMEQIRHYGIDVEYYRADQDFFKDNTVYSDWTMGQAQQLNYSHMEDMVVYTSVDVESTLTSALGIETTLNSEIYIAKQKFTETWRDTIGKLKTGDISETKTFDIINYEVDVAFKHLTDDLEATFDTTLTIDSQAVVSGSVSGNIPVNYTRIPLKVNPFLYKSPEFTERDINSDEATCTYTANVDVFGNGTIDVTMSGILGYRSSYEDINNQPNNTSLRPIAGDFIRLVEYYLGEKQIDATVNPQEYQITHVSEQELTPNGYNNLLNKYLYKCTIVRREASYEDVVGDIQEEDAIINLIDDQHRDVIIEDNSNDIFDYELEDVDDIDTQENKDGNRINNVFGGF